MSALTLCALALHLQLEGGAVAMALPTDDTYYERYEGDQRIEFRSRAFGLAVRGDLGRWQVALGARDLGKVRMHTAIADDAAYMAYAYSKGAAVAPTQHWDSVGTTRQVFTEVGYAFPIIAHAQLVPSVGVAANFMRWSYAIDYTADRTLNTDAWTVKGCAADPQVRIAPLAGLTLQGGPVGFGVYYLVTQPGGATSLDSHAHPGQGPHATYFRLTYTL